MEDRSGDSNPFLTRLDATATTVGRQMDTKQSQGEDGEEATKEDDEDGKNMKVIFGK